MAVPLSAIYSPISTSRSMHNARRLPTASIDAARDLAAMPVRRRLLTGCRVAPIRPQKYAEAAPLSAVRGRFARARCFINFVAHHAFIASALRAARLASCLMCSFRVGVAAWLIEAADTADADAEFGVSLSLFRGYLAFSDAYFYCPHCAASSSFDEARALSVHCRSPAMMSCCISDAGFDGCLMLSPHFIQARR